MTEALHTYHEPEGRPRQQLIMPSRSLIQATVDGFQRVDPSLRWTLNQREPITIHRETVLMDKGIMLAISNKQVEIFNGTEYVVDPEQSQLKFQEIVTRRTVPQRLGSSFELPGSIKGMDLDTTRTLPDEITKADFDRVEAIVKAWNVVSRDRFTSAWQLVSGEPEKWSGTHAIEGSPLPRVDLMPVYIARQERPLTIFRA